MAYTVPPASLSPEFARIAREIKEILTQYFGDYEYVEDDTRFVVAILQRFNKWGGKELPETPTPKQYQNTYIRATKRDFAQTACVLQKAYEDIQQLSHDPLAIEEISKALFDNAPEDRKRLPYRHFIEALAGLDNLGKAIQKVLDDGALFRSYWRDSNKLKRAIIRDLAFIFTSRYRKEPNNNPLTNTKFEPFLSEVLLSFGLDVPDDKTIKSELKSWLASRTKTPPPL